MLGKRVLGREAMELERVIRRMQGDLVRMHFCALYELSSA